MNTFLGHLLLATLAAASMAGTSPSNQMGGPNQSKDSGGAQGQSVGQRLSGDLDNPFGDSGGQIGGGGQATWEEYCRAFPVQPIREADGSLSLPSNHFRRAWDSADPTHRHTDPASGRRAVYDPADAQWVWESVASTVSTASTTSTTSTTGAGTASIVPAPQRFEIPWSTARATAPGAIDVHEMRVTTAPLPDWSHRQGSSTVPVDITTRAFTAGQSIDLEVYAEFDCEVYLVDEFNNCIAGQNRHGALDIPNCSRLENVVIPSTGTYRIIVTTPPGAEGTGQYTLSVGPSR